MRKSKEFKSGAEGPAQVSRRWVLTSGMTVAAAAPIAARAQSEQPPPSPAARRIAELEGVTLVVNGREHLVVLDPRTTLLDALREQLGLTGSKKGCDHGQCGACTVHVGGKRVLSCLTLAVSVREPVTTIEGLSGSESRLHPMQQAFIDQDAFQCGYCTPGQIMSAVACIDEGHADTDADIRAYMSGNLCRCAAYPHIVAAVRQARDQMKKG